METSVQLRGLKTLELSDVVACCHRGDELQACMRDFARKYQHLASPKGARGFCEISSLAFMKQLLFRGLVTEDEWQANTGAVTVKAVRGLPSSFGALFHAWVEYGGVAIDWTYRQFDASAPFPFICRKEDHPCFHYHRRLR